MAPSASWMASKSWLRIVSVEPENRPHMALWKYQYRSWSRSVTSSRWPPRLSMYRDMTGNA